MLNLITDLITSSGAEREIPKARTSKNKMYLNVDTFINSMAGVHLSLERLSPGDRDHVESRPTNQIQCNTCTRLFQKIKLAQSELVLWLCLASRRKSLPRYRALKTV